MELLCILLLAVLPLSLQTPIDSLKSNPELEPEYWSDLAKDEIQYILGLKDNKAVAKNVIMFLGDGMSVPTLTAARIFKGQLNQSPRGGEEGTLAFEKFPNSGLIKTYNINKQVPDSASTATAYLCGSKAQYKTIGMAGFVEANDTTACENKYANVDSIAQWMIDAGKDTGFVTTTRVTHATPAGLYANIPHRDWEGEAPTGCKDIATQLVEDQPGASFKVIMGGGKANLVHSERKDSDQKFLRREDNRDLIEQWKQNKVSEGAKPTVALTKEELLNVDPANTDYLMGIFDDDHMPYEDERDQKKVPHIADMTKKAIEMLSKNDKGFFLLVEGGRIDQAHHDGKAVRALNEAVAMDEAIEVALEQVNLDETLIVVTADHAHTMTMAGYPLRGNDIGGFAGVDEKDGVPYTTLLYGVGPGLDDHYKAKRKGLRCQIETEDLTEVDTSDFNFRQPSAVYLKKEEHGGDDVAVYAAGPMGHMFRTLHEQTYIAHVMAYASCVGPHFNNDHCKNNRG